MKESTKKNIKDILQNYFSRYSYVLWVSFIVRAYGASFFGSLLILLVLAVLVAWRDRQFFDEDGYELFETAEKEISNKLKMIFDKIKNKIKKMIL